MSVRRRLDQLAYLAAIAALGVLGLRPARTVRTAIRDVVLATPGATAAQVARLADSLGAPILSFRDSTPDAGALARRDGEIGTLHVVGWGLDDAEWAELREHPVVPHPAPPPPGITASWPDASTLGEPVVIAGAVRGAGPGARVVLDAPEGPRDSTVVAVQDGRFQLRDLPPLAGPRTYVVRVVPAGRVPAETLGVAVADRPRLRVLLVAGAPGFETRALRDWLGARGAAVAARAPVSRGRWRTDFVNRRAVTLLTLTAPLLRDQDVVVLDATALAALSDAERAALRRAVTQNGLGVLILPDTALDAIPLPPSDRAFFLRYATAGAGDLDQRLVRPRLPDLPPPRTPVPALPVGLEERFAVQTLLRDAAGVGLVQTSPRGAGTVAISLLDQTSRWLRAGEPEMYGAYWSRVLGRVARGGGTHGASGGPHVVHQPLPIACGDTDSAAVTVVAPSGTRDTVHCTLDPLDPGRTVGAFWPRESGWHEVAGSRWVYVSGADSWRAAAARGRLAATARAAVTSPAPRREAGRFHEERQSLPLGWAFTLFVLSAGYLWATRR